MTGSKPIYSINVMKGLSLLLLIFLNNIQITNVPSWLSNIHQDKNGMGLADWALPGFLFIIGMSIPSSLSLEYSKGKNNTDLAKFILKRSMSLIIIGVLMLNAGRVNAEFTGFGKSVWALLMYSGLFLIWNDYKENDNNFFTITGLKLAGLALLVFIVFRFRSGEFENNGSLITGGWGNVGLIGWGYMAGAMVYLAVRNDRVNTVVAFLFFLAMNILSKLGLLASIDIVKPYLGVLIDGSIPMLVIGGMLANQILMKYPDQNSLKKVSIIAVIGTGSILLGFFLHRWFNISRLQLTPSWGLICNGISMIFFALVFWIIDIKEKSKWTPFLKTAGENPLTTYIIPDILYYFILMTGVPILFYKESSIPAVYFSGALIWSLLMIWLASVLAKIGVKLKL